MHFLWEYNRLPLSPAATDSSSGLENNVRNECKSIFCVFFPRITSLLKAPRFIRLNPAALLLFEIFDLNLVFENFTKCRFGILHRSRSS